MFGVALAIFLCTSIWSGMAMRVAAEQKPPKQVQVEKVQREARRMARGFKAIERGLRAYTRETGHIPADRGRLAPEYVFWPHGHGAATWSFGHTDGPGETNAWVCLSGSVRKIDGRAMQEARRHLKDGSYVVSDACGGTEPSARPATWPHTRAVTYWIRLSVLTPFGMNGSASCGCSASA